MVPWPAADHEKALNSSPGPLLERRLFNQHLRAPARRSPADLVRWMGAVQAQDYRGGLWAIGQRLAGPAENDVEDAVAKGLVVRTWPMRRTLHLVAAEDARPMLRHLASRVVSLLPAWDEFLVAYKDRSAALGKDVPATVPPLGVIGRPVVTVDRRVRGGWRRTRTRDGVRVEIEWWGRPTKEERDAAGRASARYASFVGAAV